MDLHLEPIATIMDAAQKEPVTCWESFEFRSKYWCHTFTSPVEYPVEEAKGKGWCDVCNATCSILCFAPKTVILTLTTPYICCCAKIEDLRE